MRVVLRGKECSVEMNAPVYKAGHCIAQSEARIHTSPEQSLQYGWLAYMLGERASKKFTEHSKVFTVEGNLSSGKGRLAQQIAEKLGMKHFPEADIHYQNRILGDGHLLPEKFNGVCNLEKFYTDPKSPDGHSDFVFLDAMLKQGYVHRRCLDHYKEIKEISISELLPPHLVIYVDMPVPEVQKKIQEKGKPYEKKVSPSYLQSIEDAYKRTFLPEISESSEVLQYSATAAEDVEKVIEDIEYLKFDKGPWVEQDDVSFHQLRLHVQDKSAVLDSVSIPRFIPEITIGGSQFDKIYYEYRALPGRKYKPGYNADAGDKIQGSALELSSQVGLVPLLISKPGRKESLNESLGVLVRHWMKEQWDRNVPLFAGPVALCYCVLCLIHMPSGKGCLNPSGLPASAGCGDERSTCCGFGIPLEGAALYTCAPSQCYRLLQVLEFAWQRVQLDARSGEVFGAMGGAGEPAVGHWGLTGVL
ncbi:hypothetical protein IHE44_0014179 [Lamprotornis superbus]|uniref:Deoxynucleoside kinase domain-containing protein n=1 Tax=Lamprotornis superbus TaxID=245042 RepID=A0A835NI01_9PASS|nr:hypothetical protein IHE44_0014179 [Lamprotornis superbus]